MIYSYREQFGAILRITNSTELGTPSALMPTRADAQGVMACEMATFGMPVITSNIDICMDVFRGFENVAYIDNNDTSIDLLGLLSTLEKRGFVKNDKFFADNTVGKEVQLFKKITGFDNRG